MQVQQLRLTCDRECPAGHNDITRRNLSEDQMRRPHANHHLAGNFAPVHDELDETGLLIEGTLPTGLSGVCMRNGPNPYFEPLSYNYPFDGDGMINAVSLRNGEASYRNRFVMTGSLKSELGVGHALYGSIIDPRPMIRLSWAPVTRPTRSGRAASSM
ncbi:MAG: hypothetical protein CMM46_17635 [Rhodospirillaceae bacterium]|nr:hypothetical protein [Rhodospirillaceae bacterium]